MVFKCSFDDLMEEILTDHLVNVGSGKIASKQL